MAKTETRVVLLVDEEMCKGCELCVAVCPHQAIGLVKHINTRGFHPAGLVQPEKCTGCAQCALMCADVCIRITRVYDGSDEA